MNSFEKYLLSVHRVEAIEHVIICLKSNGELAWRFMETYLGPDWSCLPENLHFKINEAIETMRAAQC